MAFQYFKIANKTGTFVKYDDATGRAVIIVKDELQAEKLDLQTRIAAADPNQPQTKDQWAQWGKDHYPHVDHSAEQARLDEINTDIDAIKAL